MSASGLSKVVLKSNTTMTLSDRFSDIMKMKKTSKPTVETIRSGQAQVVQASTKNKRLAEQMSRRTGATPEPVAAPPSSIKNRLGVSNVSSAKSRLGRGNIGIAQGNAAHGGGSAPVARGRGNAPFARGRGNAPVARGRGNTTWGRGTSTPRIGLTPRGRGSQNRGQQRGQPFSRGARGSRGRASFGRGSTRGGGRGGLGASKATREDLDSELDSYMNVGKKDDLSFEINETWA